MTFLEKILSEVDNDQKEALKELNKKAMFFEVDKTKYWLNPSTNTKLSDYDYKKNVLTEALDDWNENKNQIKEDGLNLAKLIYSYFASDTDFEQLAILKHDKRVIYVVSDNYFYSSKGKDKKVNIELKPGQHYLYRQVWDIMNHKYLHKKYSASFIKVINDKWIKDHAQTKNHVKYYGCPVLSDITNKDHTPTQYSQAVGRERYDVLGY